MIGRTAIVLLMAGAAFGGDSEFDRLVKTIESHYGATRTKIPFLGVANLFVKAARPEGARSFKLAVFEGLKSSRGKWPERDRFMESLSDGGLRPIVSTHSRDEATYLLVRRGSPPRC